MANTLYRVFKSQKKNANDCTIRAIMALEDMTWEQVYDTLCTAGRRMKRMPNERQVLTRVLEGMGYERIGIKTEKGIKNPTVAAFTRSHPTGRYLLSVTGHVTAVRDGRYHDSWDCGEYTVFSYYRKA